MGARALETTETLREKITAMMRVQMVILKLTLPEI